MKIFIKARPASREDKIEKISADNFIVSVKAPPVKGMANRAIIKLLADYFNVSPNGIKIISGHTSRHKVIEVAPPYSF